ncbi:MAG: hypothetical protein HY347_09125 [candidate division NC10 bacterium]|nr:hypothetical protein [candidate division NC10 bacterium]
MEVRRRQRFSEYIEVRVPTRDRKGRPVPASKQREWRHRLKDFLLNDLGTTGSEDWEVQATWVGAYDPGTGTFRQQQERSLILKAYCTPAQRRAFRHRGEALLIEMGRALHQEAVAYATRDGLEILYLD